MKKSSNVYEKIYFSSFKQIKTELQKGDLYFARERNGDCYATLINLSIDFYKDRAIEICGFDLKKMEKSSIIVSENDLFVDYAIRLPKTKKEIKK